MKMRKILSLGLITASMILSACENRGCSKKPEGHVHVWSEVKYTWAEDYSSCTAERVCAEDSSHVEKETKNSIYDVPKIVSCGVQGEAVYTVTFDNSAFFTQKHTIDYSKLSHVFVPYDGDEKHVPKEPTCDEIGKSFEVCERCSRLRETMLAPIGHVWNNPTYEWNDDHSKCAATRICKNDTSHIETETVDSSSTVTTEPKCEEEGARVYTATFVNAAFSTQTYSETIPATGHDWDEPTYKSSDGMTKLTATRVCKNDPSHIETETATRTLVDPANPTCETSSIAVYMYYFDNPAFEDTRHNERQEALGHHFVKNEETLVYECDRDGCNATNGRDYEMNITLPELHAGDSYKIRDYSYSFKNDDNAFAFGWVAYKIGGTIINKNNLESGNYYFPHNLEGKNVKAYVYVGIYDETNVKYEGNDSLTVLSNVDVYANGKSTKKIGCVTQSYFKTAVSPELPTETFYCYECDLGVLLPSNNCPTLSADGKTITYGLYPQTHVGDENLISSLNGLTNPEANGWYLFEGSYYANIKANPLLSNYKFDDGSSIVKGDTYWFKCEPIVWNVLNKNNNEYYLLSSILLDAHKYDDNSNNYQESDIRNWLNNEFLNSAFPLNDSHVLITSVDNSASTTDSSSNAYTCENTEDKVFLPSYQDYLNSDYGFTASIDPTDTRISRITDYAKARGASTNPWYWTRSSCSEDAKWVWFVNRLGKIDYETVVANSAISCCVRPAINIFLNVE